MHWSAKRKSKVTKTVGARFAVETVDSINLVTVTGLPIAVAAYFWANRLLPLDMTNRGDGEVHALFITWGTAFLCAGLRPPKNALPGLCAIAASAYGFIPVLNASTTARHLSVTVPAGDWDLAGFDMGAFVVGVFSAGLTWRTRHSGVETKAGQVAATPKPVTA